MGHNSGLYNSGATGKKRQRRTAIIQENPDPADILSVVDAELKPAPEDEDGAVDEVTEKRELNTVKRLAREHTESAVKTLVTVMKSRKATHSARTQAAKALLEYGHGRPEQNIDPRSAASRDDSVRVVIFKVGDSIKEEVRVEKDVTPVAEAVEGVEILRLTDG